MWVSAKMYIGLQIPVCLSLIMYVGICQDVYWSPNSSLSQSHNVVGSLRYRYETWVSPKMYVFEMEILLCPIMYVCLCQDVYWFCNACPSPSHNVFVSLRYRYETLSAEKSAYTDEHSETIQQLTQQNETLAVTFREQLRAQQEDHRQAVEMLQGQLEHAESENYRLQRELQQVQSQRALKVEREASESPLEFVRDPRQEEREQGEVRETTMQRPP